MRDEGISTITLRFYLATLALLPWSWFPPFPWLHAHAQWSDAVFAVTAGLWILDSWRSGMKLSFRWTHIAMALYLASAAISLAMASPDRETGSMKLLGIAELCMLAVVTADMASRPSVFEKAVRIIAYASLATAAVALIGLMLFYVQIPSSMIGGYGGLQASGSYARVQAGTYHPNMLASYCIFAAALVSHPGGKLPAWLRRLTLIALGVTVLLTFSRGILGFVLAGVIRASAARRRWLPVAVVTAISLGIIVTISIWYVSINPARPLQAKIYWEDADGRRIGIITSWETFLSHPLTGSGTGTSPGMFDGYPYDAHLTPLNIAASMGLPALVSFLGLIVFLWRGRNRPTDVAVWSGLAGMGLDSLTQDIEDFRHLWVLFGLGMKEKVESGNKTPSGQDYRSIPATLAAWR